MKTETPTTELRIEGIVKPLLMEEAKQNFTKDFANFCTSLGYNFAGSIVPKEDSTGMSLYKVEEVEGYKQRIGKLEEWIATRAESYTANHEVTKTLAAQLEQKEKELTATREILFQTSHELRNAKSDYDNLVNDTIRLRRKKLELETKLRLKENTLVGRIIQKLIWAGVGAITAVSIYYINQQLIQ